MPPYLSGPPVGANGIATFGLMTYIHLNPAVSGWYGVSIVHPKVRGISLGTMERYSSTWTCSGTDALDNLIDAINQIWGSSQDA